MRYIQPLKIDMISNRTIVPPSTYEISEKINELISDIQELSNEVDELKENDN